MAKARVKKNAEDKDILKEAVDPKKKKDAPKDAPEDIVIKEPNLKMIEFKVVGTAPYVQLQFSEKARNQMAENMTTKKADKKKPGPRNFNDDYKNAFHVSTEGWHGIPSTAFKNAMVDACRNTGNPMTQIKMAVFIHHDGMDKIDGTPMIKITGKPRKVVHPVSNSGKVADMRVRAMWEKWSAKVTIEFDADAISLPSVVNLLSRAGRFIGIGEGRPYSKKTCGMGWGTFDVVQ